MTISRIAANNPNMDVVAAVSSTGDVCNETIAIPKTPLDYKSQFSVVYQGYMIFAMGGGRPSYNSRKSESSLAERTLPIK